VAAVTTQAALACDRSSDAGLKEAAKKFQEAAGVFGALRDGPSLKVEAPRPVDVGPECAAMLETLCLAQAQELTYEKARLDGKAPALLARLAKQAALHYEAVCRALASPPLATHFDKSWTTHATVKAGLYAGEAGAAAAAGLHAADEVAPEIARLRETSAALAPARAAAKSCARELADALASLDGRLTTALARAERENATVYLQRIPPASDLPPIAPASLVKPTPPGDLDGAADAATGLFAGIVPDSSAKALSTYTARVDDLVRREVGRLEGGTDDARAALATAGLPDLLAPLGGGPGATAAAIPDALRAELAALADAGGPRALHDTVAEIAGLRVAVEADLARLEGDLGREAGEDTDLRARHGEGRWARPPSSALNAGIKERLAGYRANLAAAAESDARLAGRLRDNAAGFGDLTPSGAAAALPRLAPPLVTVAGEDPAASLARLRAAVAAVDGLGAERAALEDALKVERNRDNPLPRMLSAGGGGGAPGSSGSGPAALDALFKEELAKYDPLVARVDDSLARQADLLAEVEAAAAAFKRAYAVDEWRAAVAESASALRGRVETFRELRDNLGEGLRFYVALREAVGALAGQAADFIAGRRLQRDDLLEALRRADAAGGGGGGGAGGMMAGLSLGGPPPPPPPQQYAYPPPAGQAPPPSQPAYTYAPPAYYGSGGGAGAGGAAPAGAFGAAQAPPAGAPPAYYQAAAPGGYGAQPPQQAPPQQGGGNPLADLAGWLAGRR